LFLGGFLGDEELCVVAVGPSSEIDAAAIPGDEAENLAIGAVDRRTFCRQRRKRAIGVALGMPDIDRRTRRAREIGQRSSSNDMRWVVVGGEGWNEYSRWEVITLLRRREYARVSTGGGVEKRAAIERECADLDGPVRAQKRR